MSSTQTQTQTKGQFEVEPARNIEIPRGDTKATLVFYDPPADGAAPFNYIGTPPEGQPQFNYGQASHEVTIHDIRGREQDFDMNVNGFRTVSNLVSDKSVDFDSEDSIKSQYYAEVERLLLKELPGAHRVVIFDHTIRRPTGDRQAVNRAHIDQTTKSATSRVHKHLGDEAEQLLKGRVRLINVWRPLNGPVVSSPLAYADSRSVPDSHVVPVQHRYPTWTGETAGVQHHPDGKWYYWSGMRNDERILLQCWDSQDGARTPHSAFVDPRTKKDWPGRESIEVRTLVFG